MTLCTQGEQEIAIIDTKCKLIFTAQSSNAFLCGSTFVRLLRELLTFLKQVPEKVAIIIIIILVIVIIIVIIIIVIIGLQPYLLLPSN